MEKTDTEIDFKRSCYGGRPFSITITCEKEDAGKLFEAAWNGSKWLRFHCGKLEVAESYEAPPPVRDMEMQPFWPVETAQQSEMILGGEKSYESGVIVKHIHGYSGKYDQKAAVLEECGFECMRSRRGESGKYWEYWYLPGKWRAKGPIKGMDVAEIRKWIFDNISPGNVVIEGENWGLCAPE
jgi:hypothetical protein